MMTTYCMWNFDLNRNKIFIYIFILFDISKIINEILAKNEDKEYFDEKLNKEFKKL